MLVHWVILEKVPELRVSQIHSLKYSCLKREINFSLTYQNKRTVVSQTFWRILNVLCYIFTHYFGVPWAVTSVMPHDAIKMQVSLKQLFQGFFNWWARYYCGRGIFQNRRHRSEFPEKRSNMSKSNRRFDTMHS